MFHATWNILTYWVHWCRMFSLIFRSSVDILTPLKVVVHFYFFFTPVHICWRWWINGSYVAFSDNFFSFLQTTATSWWTWWLFLHAESKIDRHSSFMPSFFLWKSSIERRHGPDSELRNLFGSSFWTILPCSAHACVLQVEFRHFASPSLPIWLLSEVFQLI